MKRHRNNKPKYLNHHLSYRQRLRLLTGTKYMNAKQAKEMYLLGLYLIKYGKLPTKTSKRPKIANNKPINRGNRFTVTVNQKQLSKAVHAMYLRKHKQYPLSINKICKKFQISKPSLYRGYKAKYTDK